MPAATLFVSFALLASSAIADTAATNATSAFLVSTAAIATGAAADAVAAAAESVPPGVTMSAEVAAALAGTSSEATTGGATGPLEAEPEEPLEDEMGAGNETSSGVEALSHTRGQCSFAVPPDVPYYWEPQCRADIPGCWADGVHMQCRFCGSAPFTGIPCPEPGPPPRSCQFDAPPGLPYYWEPQCRIGMLGCFADRRNLKCRFCGAGQFGGIACPASTCSFRSPPRTPFYWEPDCRPGMVGCMADSVHLQCRFCVKRPFDQIRCPASVKVPDGHCSFPGNEPATPYYWEPDCEIGKLGCWADGLNAECRWCGTGAYKDVPCKRG